MKTRPLPAPLLLGAVRIDVSNLRSDQPGDPNIDHVVVMAGTSPDAIAIPIATIPGKATAYAMPRDGLIKGSEPPGMRTSRS